jgi:hypothetical protein
MPDKKGKKILVVEDPSTRIAFGDTVRGEKRCCIIIAIYYV